MIKILRIPSTALFYKIGDRQIPDKITLLADLKNCDADIDVIIGSDKEPEAVNLTIENYLVLEKKARIHILVIEASRSLSTFLKIRSGPNVSKIQILSHVPCTKKAYNERAWASDAAAFAAQIGSFLGKARYAFFSHTDMMGYQKNFLSYLQSKLNKNTPIASFTQRHVLPFTGGMIYDKEYFCPLEVDWLPRFDNPYKIQGFEQLRNRIENLNWLDTGEQLIMETFQQGQQAYIADTRGNPKDYYGSHLAVFGLTGQEINQLKLPIHYASNKLSREDFTVKYPELAMSENGRWRKAFSEEGNLLFIHRGRGTTFARRHDRSNKHDDFVTLVREFNQKSKHASH